MDSLTHLAIGACVGEAILGKQAGKKAILWGALLHSVPDIDVVPALWMDIPGSLLAHRGFTHSILCCLLVTLSIALLARRMYRKYHIPKGRWIFFAGSAVFLHILIDAFTSYGVGWYEPFSHYRVTFNAIYIVDPLFSIWPVTAAIVLVFSGMKNNFRKYWPVSPLCLCGLFLLYCLYNKYSIDHRLKNSLRQQHTSYTRYLSTPAPFQNWLWYVVAGSDSGYYTGYLSVFDRDKTIRLQFFPRNDTLLKSFRMQEATGRLIRFSQQFYTVEKRGDTITFNDLRFGQVQGWRDAGAPFVFHYFLHGAQNNALRLQNGRTQGWDRDAVKYFIKRVKGN